MIKRLIIVFQTSFLLLFFLSLFCYSQEVKDNRIDFIKVYSSQLCPRPPFAKQEIEISNNQICYRNVLPPRHKMNKEHLDVYDSWDIKPKYQKIETVDYDSIVNFILTSGLLNIDLNYTKPDTTGGLIFMKIGACSYQYVIETSEKEISLLILGVKDFKLPEILIDFDRLFKRILSKYNDENE
ncbi:MAG: hypothetical protein K8R58_00765 [Bacteroidales bacterium]|nr:hypothetical protein [Bacteroidales bacterium]